MILFQKNNNIVLNGKVYSSKAKNIRDPLRDLKNFLFDNKKFENQQCNNNNKISLEMDNKNSNNCFTIN